MQDEIKFKIQFLSGTSHIGLGAPVLSSAGLGFLQWCFHTLWLERVPWSFEWVWMLYLLREFVFLWSIGETRYDKGDPKQPKFLWTNIQNLGQDGDWGCNSFRKEILRRKKTVRLWCPPLVECYLKIKKFYSCQGAKKEKRCKICRDSERKLKWRLPVSEEQGQYYLHKSVYSMLL